MPAGTVTGTSSRLSRSFCSGLVDLVEYATVGKMRGLRLGPAAKVTVNRRQRNDGELAFVLCQDFGIAGAVEVLRPDLLGLRRVKKFQEGFRRGTALVPI